MAAVAESVDILRTLAAKPSIYRPELANALNTMAEELSDSDQTMQAVLASGEDVALYRERC